MIHMELKEKNLGIVSLSDKNSGQSDKYVRMTGGKKKKYYPDNTS